MKFHLAHRLVVAAAWLSAALCAPAQAPLFKNIPALPGLPNGYQQPAGSAPNPWRGAGMGDSVSGEKKLDLGKCYELPFKSHLSYGWTAGGMQLIVDSQARQPEAPAQRSPISAGAREEPAGKSAYRGGLITFRKITIPASISIDSTGNCNGRTEDMYSANWLGVVNAKMITIDISLANGKAEAQGIVDGLIGQMTSLARAIK